MNWYGSVLFGLNLLSVIAFILIPVLSVLAVFFAKRKYLWTVPIISTFLMIIFCVVVSGPSLLTVGEYRAMFFGISVPIQLGVVIVLTALAYVAAYLLKRKQSK